ncbi:hypothetical protein OQA88_7354 [Cercophora sp. LCS_1]
MPALRRNASRRNRAGLARTNNAKAQPQIRRGRFPPAATTQRRPSSSCGNNSKTADFLLRYNLKTADFLLRQQLKGRVPPEAAMPVLRRNASRRNRAGMGALARAKSNRRQDAATTQRRPISSRGNNSKAADPPAATTQRRPSSSRGNNSKAAEFLLRHNLKTADFLLRYNLKAAEFLLRHNLKTIVEHNL